MRSTLIMLLSLLGACFAQNTDTLSCTGVCCCKTDLTPSGIMISHVHSKGEWMLSYRYMNMSMSGLQSGAQSINQSDVFVKYLMSPNKMQMNMHMLMGMYGITDRFTAMAMLNYSTSSMSMDMLEVDNMSGMIGMTHVHSNGQDMNMKTSGIGDVQLYLMYGLINKNNHQLLVSAGMSIPSGSIQMKGSPTDNMYPNQRMPYGMQLGSGTVDVMPCINYLYQQDKFAFSAQALGIIRPGYNTVGYKPGNEAKINTWLAYKYFNFLSSSLRLEGTTAAPINGYDYTLYYYNEPAANPHNYGGQRINAYIGSSFHFNKGFIKNNRLSLEYGLPLYNSVNGIQMKTKQLLYASWSLTF